MVITVFSCDKDSDLFYPFYKCMEKYWPNHPEIIYLTETIINPYYKTITKNYPLNMWTKRIRESLAEINDDIVLTMIDDFFLNDYVNIYKLGYIENILKNDTKIASISFELAFSKWHKICLYNGIAAIDKEYPLRVALNCGLWDKNKLINILTRNKESDPWTVEKVQDDKGYDYYMCNGSKVLSWYFDGPNQRGALVFGKWHKNMVPFFNYEEINIDFNARGFYDINDFTKLENSVLSNLENN